MTLQAVRAMVLRAVRAMGMQAVRSIGQMVTLCDVEEYVGGW